MDRIERHFGDGVVRDEEVDRPALAQVVFSDADELIWLEGLLHPHVKRLIDAWAREQESVRPAPPLLVAEVPLLYETNMAEVFDYVLLVTAPEDHRRKRLVAKLTASEFSRRAARQLPEADKAARSRFVFENVGGREPLKEYVGEVYATILAERGERGSSPAETLGVRRLLVIAGLALVAVALAWGALQVTKPVWYLRLGPSACSCGRHQLRGDQEPARPGPGSRGHLRGEPLSRRRQLTPGRGRADAGPAVDRSRRSPARPVATAFVVADLTDPRSQHPVRLLLPARAARPLRRLRESRRWPPTTPARATSTRGCRPLGASSLRGRSRSARRGPT